MIGDVRVGGLEGVVGKCLNDGRGLRGEVQVRKRGRWIGDVPAVQVLIVQVSEPAR